MRKDLTRWPGIRGWFKAEGGLGTLRGEKKSLQLRIHSECKIKLIAGEIGSLWCTEITSVHQKTQT